MPTSHTRNGQLFAGDGDDAEPPDGAPMGLGVVFGQTFQITARIAWVAWWMQLSPAAPRLN